MSCPPWTVDARIYGFLRVVPFLSVVPFSMLNVDLYLCLTKVAAAKKYDAKRFSEQRKAVDSYHKDYQVATVGP